MCMLRMLCCLMHSAGIILLLSELHAWTHGPPVMYLANAPPAALLARY